MQPELAEHLALFRASLPDDIHPAGRATIEIWLQSAEAALVAGDMVEASRLLRNVNAKIALEQDWPF